MRNCISQFFSRIFIIYLALHIESSGAQFLDSGPLFKVIQSWNELQQNQISGSYEYKRYHPKVDVASGRRFLPDLGSLIDMLFLLAPRDFPASGIVRLSRDIFESEQCVEYVGCEVTNMSYKHKSLHWVLNFLQDSPFQGDLADKLRHGSLDAVTRLKNKKQGQKPNGVVATINPNNNTKTEELLPICSFSCHPILSLSRGLKILGLLHDLIRTVR